MKAYSIGLHSFGFFSSSLCHRLLYTPARYPFQHQRMRIRRWQKYLGFLGLWLAAPRIAGMIAREAERASFDLLCLSSVGRGGAVWLITLACMSKIHSEDDDSGEVDNDRWRLLPRIRFGLCLVILTYILYLFNGYLLPGLSFKYDNVITYAPLGFWAILLTYAFALMVVISCERNQSPAISALIGMWVPHYVTRPADAQLIALCLFGLIQIITFGLIYLLDFIAVPAIVGYYGGWNGWIGDMYTPFFQVIIFIVLREGVIYYLWNRLDRDLETTGQELDLAFRLGV